MRTLQHYFKLWGKRSDNAIQFKRNYRVEKLSYRLVFQHAAKTAALLKKKKVKKKQCVILWGSNSPEWIASFFGCVLQGAIVVPIDYNTHPDVVKKIKRETKAKLMICSRKHKGKIKMQTVVLEDLHKAIDKLNPLKSFPKANIKDTVEIVYTSGTTGDPKGVVLTHENLVSNMESTLSVLPLKEDHKFLSIVPLSHLLGQSGLFIAFAIGASVTYLQSPSSRSITNMLQRDKFTALVCVPKMLESLQQRMLWDMPSLKFLHALATPIPGPLKLIPLIKLHHHLNFLKLFICGGAYLDPELERWWDVAGIRVIQGYGLTETSPVISYNRIFKKRRGSVGEVIPNVEVKIAIDEEICVKSKSVFKGYYKKPKKTAEVLTSGWFKTGDQGYFKNDYLYLKGRKKDMIVTAEGLNIYPEDIEQVLSKVKGVQDCAVVGYPKDYERVHAFLILSPGTKPRKVIEQANKYLSQTQQIQAYTLWPDPSFPRTPTLKVKKFQLIEFLDKQRKDIKEEKARDPVIQLIAEVTNAPIKKIKPKARLSLDLKLSSLDRVELIARLEQELHVDIEETAIGPDTTVEQLLKMAKGTKLKKRRSIRRWSSSNLASAIRRLTQPLFAFWVKKYCDITVKGKYDTKHPQCLIVANHTSHFDVAVLMMSLPKEVRRNTAAAVWAEYFERPAPLHLKLFRWIQYKLGPLLINGYLFPQAAGFRQAFDNTGELVDKGWNILLFPEGERTMTGKMKPFRPGVGLLAPALNIPIVPIKIEGLMKIWPRTGWIGPGKVTVKIGKPFMPKQKTTLGITKEIESKVRKL